MLLKQMQYYVSIVEENSFTEAAEKNFISQSAISQAMNSLEDDLGVKLIKSFPICRTIDFQQKG